MADYMDDRVGFVLPSHPEPTYWPHDPDHRYETTWNRLVWSELRDAFLRAADVAEHDRPRYDALAAEARLRMHRLAGRGTAVEALRAALRRPTDDRAVA